MGIISHKDVFTHKFITAIIKDSSGRGHIRHIKHVIGDHWVTDIDKQTYVFKIDDSRIITYKETAARSCRILFYSTKHYMPLSPEDNKQLEETLRSNGLPRMNTTMFGAFKLLSQKEKKKQGEKFENHDIVKLVNEVESNAGKQFTVQVQNLKQYFENLAVYKIITPVREVTEFIEDDLLATDAKYIGDIYNAMQRTDFKHSKISNAKIDAKKNYIMIFALIGIVGAVAAMGYMLIANGGLTSLLPQLGPSPSTQQAITGQPPPPGTKMTDAQVFQKYPDPGSLQKAVNSGEIQMSQLSPKMQDMVKSYHAPVPKAQ